MYGTWFESHKPVSETGQSRPAGYPVDCGSVSAIAGFSSLPSYLQTGPSDMKDVCTCKYTTAHAHKIRSEGETHPEFVAGEVHSPYKRKNRHLQLTVPQ